MAYATSQDIVDAHGIEALLLVADRDCDGEIDAGVVERALDAASDLIDLHVLSRYPAPWPSVPGAVRDLAVDIALYRMSGEGRGLTDERRRRYEDALALLKSVAAGTVDLDIPEPAGAAPQDGAEIAGPVERLFDRQTLAGW